MKHKYILECITFLDFLFLHFILYTLLIVIQYANVIQLQLFWPLMNV